MIRHSAIFTLLLLALVFAACHKTTQKKTAAGHTDGIGGPRNWHVYAHYKIHRSLAGGGAQYSDTAWWAPDQTFALPVADGDTVLFENTKYGYSGTEGSKAIFTVWHKQYSGSPNTITYNTDSNTVRIYITHPGANADDEYWYYSY